MVPFDHQLQIVPGILLSSNYQNATIMDKLKSAEQLTVQNAVTTETGTGRIIRPEKFFPSGAIAFFIALVILCLVIWFGIYFLMIERI